MLKNRKEVIVAKKTKYKKLKGKTVKKRNKKHYMFKLAIKICVIAFIFLFTYLLFCLLTLPNIDEAINRTRMPSTTIIAENGNEVHSYGTVYSEIITPNELPQYVIDSIVYTEDRRFYSHFGFDVISFTRAMIVNLFAGRFVQGGSTITQQVAKNLFLSNKKTINRKTQELLLSFWLESKFNKEQILTLYLNRVYFGNGAYGIEAAAQKYFQKTSRDLNILEGAILAGMLKAPSRYNPIASKKRALERATIVLNLMKDNKLLSETDLNRVLNMPIGKEKPAKVKNGIYFADFAYNEIIDYIGEQETDIYALTTLDQSLQEKAATILKQEIEKAVKNNVSQGAIVIMSKDGAIKALVGGTDYNKSQFNRATQALRQPGSAFKLFVYLCAISQGYIPDDIIEDKPINIGGWMPKNHDGNTYGKITLKHAFAKSLNLATINLAKQLGIKNIIKIAQTLGITSELKNDLSLSLGTSAVKAIDIATAYATIANGGLRVNPYSIKEIYTNDGFQLYQRNADNNLRIIREDFTIMMKDLLMEVIKTGTGINANINRDAYGKTGTTQDNRDAWFIGFDDNLIGVVWVGNDDNSPMINVYGSGLPAKIWKKLMQ